MLRVTGDNNTLSTAFIYDTPHLEALGSATQTRETSPWRTIESTVAVVLIASILALPMFTVQSDGFTRSVTIWGALNFLMDMVCAGIGSHGTIVLAAALFLLLAIGIGSMLDTLILCTDAHHTGRAVVSSWGMVVFGIGMVTLCQMAENQILDGMLGLGTLYLEPAVWFAVIGGAACGLIDIIRCARKS